MIISQESRVQGLPSSQSASSHEGICVPDREGVRVPVGDFVSDLVFDMDREGERVFEGVLGIEGEAEDDLVSEGDGDTVAEGEAERDSGIDPEADLEAPSVTDEEGEMEGVACGVVVLLDEGS